MDAERRFIEFRADGDTISGPLMVYGDEARFGDFSETFEPGSLRYDDVIANLQHDRSRPVARTGAGLTLIDGADALRAEIRLPDTSYAREARELVEARILRGFSVEFRAREERFEGKRRIISRADMLGFALVDRPAYPASQIADRIQSDYDGITRRGLRGRRVYV